jgi:hypothetical protein
MERFWRATIPVFTATDIPKLASFVHEQFTTYASPSARGSYPRAQHNETILSLVEQVLNVRTSLLYEDAIIPPVLICVRPALSNLRLDSVRHMRLWHIRQGALPK